MGKRLIGSKTFAAAKLCSISSAAKDTPASPTQTHVTAGSWAADKNGLCAQVSAQDALCAFDTTGYESKHVQPTDLTAGVVSMEMGMLSALYLDIGSIKSAWSSPTYASRPSQTMAASLSMAAFTPGSHISIPLALSDEQNRVVATNGIYLSLRAGGLLAGAAASGAGVSLSPMTLYAQVYEIVPEAQNISPAGGYAEPGKALTVTWEFYADKGLSRTPKQAAWELEYRSAGAAATLSGASEQRAVIPAAAFSEDTLFYRLRVKSDDGVWSAWSDEIRLSSTPLSRECTAISPSGRYLTPGERVAFVWRHASRTGSAQAKARLYARSGGALTLLCELDQRAQSAEVALPNTLESGEWSWSVQTVDTNEEESLMSSALFNTVLAPPAAPEIAEIAQDAVRPVIEWFSHSAQRAYRLTITDSNECVVYDTGQLPGEDERHRAGEYLLPGRYTAKLEIWNEYALKSPESKRGFIIGTPTGLKPTLFAAPVRAGVALRADNDSFDELHLFRDGRMIKKLFGGEKGEYTDFAAAGSAEYKCRIVWHGGEGHSERFAESDAVRCAPIVHTAIISSAHDPGDYIELALNRDAPPRHTAKATVSGAALALAGREMPAAEFGQVRRTHAHSFSLLDMRQFKRLEALVESRCVLFYRDPHESYYCAAFGLESRRDALSVDFTLTLTEVDYAGGYEDADTD